MKNKLESNDETKQIIISIDCYMLYFDSSI